MILTFDQLLQVISKNPNKNLIGFGEDQRSRARMHMYGVDMEQYITQIKGFEQPWLRELRLKYIQSNKDIFARLLKPVTKVFTARGGSTYYNMTNKENDRASEFAGNIQNGISVKKWLESYWKQHLFDDPMGLVFMEIDERGQVYPTYKSITDIFDYKVDQGKLEYVIFVVPPSQKIELGLEKETQVFRVVDDAFDQIVYLKDQDTLIVVDGQTFPNYFGYTPGILNSPFINPDGDGYITPLYWVLDLADQYLLKIGIKILQEFRHGFAKYWEFGDDCIECKGTGKKQGSTCAACMGTGRKIMIRPADSKIVEWPTKDSGSTFSFRGAPGGYIEPSEIFHNIMREGLLELEEKIYQTIWGSKTATKLKPGLGLSAAPNGIVTATEVMDNRQPEVDALNAYSDAAETRDKFIMDSVISVKIRRNYAGCSKNYGRRFLIEEPDALLDRYNNSRKEGVSASVLYGLYEQYLEAKYQSDGVSLSLYKKLLKIEPFMHYTVSDLKNMGATPEQIRDKMYWGEWLASMSNAQLIMSTPDRLLELFQTFVSDKQLIQEPVTTNP